jgi:hypothetical protein
LDHQRPKIVVLGSMCLIPVPGVVFQMLHYLLGLEALGFEAYYVEWHGNWVDDPHHGPPQSRPKVPIARTMRDHGFAGRWTCRADYRAGGAFGDFPPDRLRALYREADAILNVTGEHLIDDDMAGCGVRIYIETDPGLPQVRLFRGDAKQADLIAGHTHHRAFGELVGTTESKLPEVGVAYRPTRQPVVLDLWEQPDRSPAGELTTIARWMRPTRKTVEFAGDTYHWHKRHAFLPFLDLPQRSGASFSLALSEIDEQDRLMLTGNGWHVLDAVRECTSLAGYRRFIRRSRGEFTAAKDQYVRFRTGWFSDRSACYLAAGRPVITQDTGFSKCLPTGTGLLAYQTADEALSCVEALISDYGRHSAAAVEIAHEYFDARRVLTDLLEGCGVEVPRAVVAHA